MDKLRQSEGNPQDITETAGRTPPRRRWTPNHSSYRTIASYGGKSTTSDRWRCLVPERSGKVDFVFMDPPYSTHLDYGDDPRDIGKLDVAAGDAYYAAMEQAFREAHRLLKPGKHLALYVGDSFVKAQGFYPIGFELFSRLRKVGFEPIDIVAVVRHNKTLDMGNYRK